MLLVVDELVRELDRADQPPLRRAEVWIEAAASAELEAQEPPTITAVGNRHSAVRAKRAAAFSTRAIPQRQS